MLNEPMILELRLLAAASARDSDACMRRQAKLAAEWEGKEAELEDIIYDHGDPQIRIEAMMVCKRMAVMDRQRIYRDLWLADQDEEVRQWARGLLLQEIQLEMLRKPQ